MKKFLPKVNVILPAIIFTFSVFYLSLARRYHFGTIKRPGVGFLPFLSGFLLVLLSLYQTVMEIRKRAEHESHPIGWKKLLLFFAIAGFDALIMEMVGFGAAACILLFLTARLYGAESWLKPLLFALLLSASSYYIFVVWLHVPLP